MGNVPLFVHDLDDTDLELLHMLLSNARQPYSEMAQAVGLSPPAVSDRIARLRDIGIIRRFTIDIDRSQLRDGIRVLLTLSGINSDHHARSLEESLIAAGAVEHVFVTATSDLVVYTHLPSADVTGWLEETIDTTLIDDISVTLLQHANWSPDVDETALALRCAECGNTVDSEGTTARFGGDLYQFCCPSCEARFEEKYAQLQEHSP